MDSNIPLFGALYCVRSQPMIITRTRQFFETHRPDIFWMVVILVVAAVPRLLDLGIFLTADEKNWMMRGYEFVRAFKDGRFNDMLQTTHPGVTVLWLTGVVVYATMFLKHTLFNNENLPAFIYSAQLAVALLNTGLLVLIYWLLRRLLNNRALAVTAGLLMALNPWLIGYSRVVHIDAVVAGFMLAAALSLLIWAKEGYPRRWLVGLAGLAAAAILSKAPAVFLLPYFWLVVLVIGSPSWKKRVVDFVLWVVLIAVLFVVAWPAMICVPDRTGNALVLKRDYIVATTTPHDANESFSTNLWHYPATVLTRAEPTVLGLSLFFAGWLVWSRYARSRRAGQKERKIGWLLLGYVFFFVIMMTLGAKKGDRYILPLAPALDVLAALGAAVLFRGRRFMAVAGLLVLISAATVAYYHPYALAYSNPLFPDHLSQELGWGEGLEQVGKWFDQHDPMARVAAWYPEELGYFTKATVLHINAHEQPAVGYVVLYRNMFGRPQSHPANNFIEEYYRNWLPVFVARVAGKEYAWVYKRPAFTGVAGELGPGRIVTQATTIKAPRWVGLDIMAATYSGRAQTGELVVVVRGVHEWRVPVQALNDTGWTRLLLPAPVEMAGQELLVAISANGTREGKAPTMRVGPSGLAIRQLFAVGDGIAHEYEAKRWGQLVTE